MKRFLAFFLFLILTLNVQAEDVIVAQELHAKSAVLMDAKSGRILYEKNGNERLAMASTTKIMTCILALEQCELQEIVQVSKHAAAQPKVHLGMKVGEQYYLRDLLYSLMLESHNDAAVAIAEHVSGSTSAFSNLMNEKAKEIGCTNTYFITPNGLDEIDKTGFHSTTAKELAKIMKYCIRESKQNKMFLKITSTPEYTFSNVNQSRSFSCTNRNLFLNMMSGAISGKTGFTGKAGYCYVGALERDGKMFIVALLACGWPNNKNYKWKDTRMLMEYGLEHYFYDNSNHINLPKIKVEDAVPIDKNIFHETYISTSTEEVQVLRNKNEEIQIITEYNKCIKAPIKKGEIIGTIKYYVGDTFVVEKPIVARESAEKKTLQCYWSAFIKLYLL